MNAHIYRCSTCSFVHFEINQLRSHFKTKSHSYNPEDDYDTIYPIRCDFCKKGFYFHESKALHEKDEHGKEIEPESCGVCPQEFFTKSSLFVHLSWHSSQIQTKKFFVCSYCPWAEYDAQDLIQHHKTSHMKQSLPFFACDKCKFHTVSLSFMENHLDKEHNIKYFMPYSCEDCTFGSKDVKAYARHLKGTGHGKPVKCKFCSERFKTAKDQRSHTVQLHEKEKPCPVPVCQRMFKRRMLLEFHIDRTHPGLKPAEYKCQVCSKDFMFPSSYKHCVARHKRGKTEPSLVLKRKKSVVRMKPTERLQCKQCELSFAPTAFAKFARHEFLDHGIKKFPKVCDKCSQPYERYHKTCFGMKKRNKPAKPRPVRIYSCPDCDKEYHMARDLAIHVKSFHKNERPFKCTKCDKSFSGAKTLSDHMGVSHNPQTCSDCRKIFTNMFNLRRHVYFDHGATEGAYLCDECPRKVFFSKKTHEFHLKRFHVKKESSDKVLSENENECGDQ